MYGRLKAHAAHLAQRDGLYPLGYAVARTALALGSLGTLLATPFDLLFWQHDQNRALACSGLRELSVVCMTPQQYWPALRVVMIAVLVVVASGYRPRATGFLHWLISWSMMTAAVIDGGDQVTAILTLLLLPATLLDRRRWHWTGPSRAAAHRPDRFTEKVVATTSLQACRVQVAVIYLQASVAKLGRTEWADGTALYYWLDDPSFGAEGLIRHLLEPVLASDLGVTALTWGTVALEFALALTLLVRPLRRPMLWLGLVFHLAIAFVMGLPSFSLAMTGGLALLCLQDLPARTPAGVPPDRLPSAETGRLQPAPA